MSYAQKLIALDCQHFINGRNKRSRAGFKTLSTEQCLALTAHVKEKHTSLWQDINAFWQKQDEEARVLSIKHDKPLAEMKTHLQ